MGKKLIEVKHDVRDYECMWSGIEDLYSARLQEFVPPFFFFTMSGTGNFIYLKGEDFRQAAWSNGRVDKMYDFMGPIARFSYQHTDGLTFKETMELAKAEIDQDRPVILGPVDMYYLSYFPKIYQRVHIPIHYVMMVGYDEEKAYLIDGGVAQMQEVAYSDLEIALNVRKTELGDKNGIYAIKIADQLPSLFEIAKEALNQKAKDMLKPKQAFMGIEAMRRLAYEFPTWKQELSPKAYKSALENLAMYAGTVPQLPMRLFGGEDKGDIIYQAGREKMVEVLETLGQRYHVSLWLEAAQLFKQSGVLIEEMVNHIVDVLLQQKQELDEVPQLILQIAKLEEQAYQALQKCI